MPKGKLRLVEHYASPQCEGPRTGTMTQFVRFAGCNMKCPLWPCDTDYAIDPAIYREGSSWVEPFELAERVAWMCRSTGASNVCLTGGEPFLQDNDALHDLVMACDATFECFSNGSFSYPDWSINVLDFVMDWKLPGSGEWETRIEQREKNALKLMSTDAIKFVVASDEDLEVAAETYDGLLGKGCRAHFWVGPAWDKYDPIKIIDYIKSTAYPWKLNLQVHKMIWPPDMKGV